jgi:hypothetical protein
MAQFFSVLSGIIGTVRPRGQTMDGEPNGHVINPLSPFEESA